MQLQVQEPLIAYNAYCLSRYCVVCTCIGAFTAILIRILYLYFRSLVGRNTQSHPLNWAVITEHKFTHDSCHYYSWTLIHESLPDTRIPTDSKLWYTDSHGFKTVIHGLPRIQNCDTRITTDSKLWYTDYHGFKTVIHGFKPIAKIPGYYVIHKKYPWYSDTGVIHWYSDTRA